LIMLMDDCMCCVFFFFSVSLVIVGSDVPLVVF